MRALWLWLVVFRVANSLIVGTYHNPDEFWQGPEVAHWLVYGRGHLTWEWQPDAQLRSFVHPALLAAPVWVLSVLGLDTWWRVATVPRVMQALFAATGDAALVQAATRWFGVRTGWWTLWGLLTCWFAFYAGVRTYADSFAASGTCVALWFLADAMPWVKRRRETLLWPGWGLAALVCVVRPPCTLLWAVVAVEVVHSSPNPWRVAVHGGVVTGGVIAACCALDSYLYGGLVFPALNFARFNSGAAPGALFGEHPPWYYAVMLPAVVWAMALPATVAVLRRLPGCRAIATAVAVYIGALSFIPHKEERFCLPVAPLCLLLAACQLATMPRVHKVFTAAVALPCIVAAGYLSVLHQGGVIAATNHLAATIASHPAPATLSVDFLLPCHSTPATSTIHVDVPLWFPDCSPVNRQSTEPCESDALQEDFVGFVDRRYSVVDLPSHMVVYSAAAAPGSQALTDLGFQVDARFLHLSAEENQGPEVLVLRRNDVYEVEALPQWPHWVPWGASGALFLAAGALLRLPAKQLGGAPRKRKTR